MPVPQKIIVGRNNDLGKIRSFLDNNQKDYFIFNLFGPGGIGKTELRKLLQTQLLQNNIKCAFIDGNDKELNFARILLQIREEIFGNQKSEKVRKFDENVIFYLKVNGFINKYGLDVLIENADELIKIDAIETGIQLIKRLKLIFSNRFELEHYIQKSQPLITSLFVNCLNEYYDASGNQIIIIFDAYEKLESLDYWICQELVSACPQKTKLLFFSRDSLLDMSFGWKEFTNNIDTHYLDEIKKLHVNEFFNKHGVDNQSQIDNIYKFTGGYPLCMTLAVDLAKKIGWGELGDMNRLRDRYQVAKALLDRLLEEEKTKDVKIFIENGVVFPYFNIEIIACLLDISIPKAENIFNTLLKLSFIEKSGDYLKFHDRVQEILLERLKFIGLINETKNKARDCLQKMKNNKIL